ncbi:MAG: hypothetical protein LBG45_02255 [Dysgonamonadaceae bacterium]|jgi:hypothetical protein|nr:hypothetical protein [Dysgonamonadaceae bacterium]
MKSHFIKQGILANTLMIISVLTIFTFSSCNKEEMDNNETVINDNYYVKYVISCSYPKIFSNWSVTTPQGNYTKNDYQTRHWEQTYGHVKKGFKCEAQVGRGEPTIEIYVSKNQEPFALKTTKTGNSALYTIDF